MSSKAFLGHFFGFSVFAESESYQSLSLSDSLCVSLSLSQHRFLKEAKPLSSLTPLILAAKEAAKANR